MDEIVIDATDLILGRLASLVSKMALEGKKVVIINAEKAIVSGKKKAVFEEYFKKIERGDAIKGPFFPRRADLILKRTIRGMLPYKKERGRKALKRIKVFLGVPKEYEGKAQTLVEAHLKNSNVLKYVRLEDISNYLGGNQ